MSNNVNVLILFTRQSQIIAEFSYITANNFISFAALRVTGGVCRIVWEWYVIGPMCQQGLHQSASTHFFPQLHIFFPQLAIQHKYFGIHACQYGMSLRMILNTCSMLFPLARVSGSKTQERDKMRLLHT